MARIARKYTDKISKSHHELYHLHKDKFEHIRSLISNLTDAEGITDNEILEIIKKKDQLKAVPLSIFTSWLGPLEALVKYMKENMRLTISEIAVILNRDHRTIWLTYSNSRKKRIEISIQHDNFVPLDIFGNRELSILENLSSYLHDVKGMKFKEIADLTKKDSRTIWTVYNRAQTKRGKK